jgi:hypothetical protein
VSNEADGVLRLRVMVQPRAHTFKLLRVLYAPHAPGMVCRQLGRGLGRYDAKTGRYYFNVGYQKIHRRADGRTDSGDWQEITGWVHPGTNAAAVAHRAAL